MSNFSFKECIGIVLSYPFQVNWSNPEDPTTWTATYYNTGQIRTTRIIDATHLYNFFDVPLKRLLQPGASIDSQSHFTISTSPSPADPHYTDDEEIGITLHYDPGSIYPSTTIDLDKLDRVLVDGGVSLTSTCFAIPQATLKSIYTGVSVLFIIVRNSRLNAMEPVHIFIPPILEQISLDSWTPDRGSYIREVYPLNILGNRLPSARCRTMVARQMMQVIKAIDAARRPENGTDIAVDLFGLL